MSPARLAVRAVVVSDGQSGRLGAVLDAVTSQDPAPDHVLVVMADGASAPELPPHSSVVVAHSASRDFGAAVRDGVADLPAQPGELLWLLHDDSAPMPGTLATLTAVARKRRQAGVIGAAHVRWDDPSRLVSLGTTTTRSGLRRVTLIDEDDVNQGQYDSRDDVLGVSLAGALVRRDVWEELGGTDATYHGWGDSLDFCRRVWRSGRDVVIAPAARIRHSQERLYGRRGVARDRRGGPPARGRRSTYGARQTAEWYQALAFARWWMVLPYLVWAFVAAVGRAVLRIAQNEPRLLWADLTVPWRLLAKVPRLPRSRKAIRRAGKAGRAVERPLLASRRQVWQAARAREWGAYESWRAANAPSDVVRAELRVVARRRRIALTATLVTAAVASVLLHGSWMLGLIRGRMLSGGALGVTDVSLADVWERALGGWTEQGFGAAAIDSGLGYLTVPLAALPGGLATGLGVVLAAAPVWAVLTAWAMSGAFTRSLATRILTSLAYGLWPVFLASVAEGRVGAVVTHVLVPLAVLGLTRAAGWHVGEVVGDGEEFPTQRVASPSAAMGGALVMALVVVATPGALWCVLPAVAIAGAFAGRWRWRVWGMVVPSLVVALPGILAAIDAGLTTAAGHSVLFREPGPSLSEGRPVLEVLLTPLGSDDSVPAALSYASTALVIAFVSVGVVGAVLARRWSVSTAALATAAGGYGFAALAAATLLSPDAGAGAARPNGWAGPGLSLVAIALVVATANATRGAWHEGEGRARAWRRTALSATALVAAVVLGAHITALAWPGRTPDGGVTAVTKDVLPLVAALEQSTDQRQRAVVLAQTDAGVVASVLATDGTEVVTTAAELVDDNRVAARQSATVAVSTDVIAEPIADLVGGADGAAAELAQWGIGVVVAAPGDHLIEASLSQSAELSLLGASDRGTSYRITRGDGEPASRAWVEFGDGDTLGVPMEYQDGRVEVMASDPQRLIVAASADSAWHATLDGRKLEAVEDEAGRQAFAVDEPGVLRLSYDDPTFRTWWWAGVIVLAWALVGSIPVTFRGYREARA